MSSIGICRIEIVTAICKMKVVEVYHTLSKCLHQKYSSQIFWICNILYSSLGSIPSASCLQSGCWSFRADYQIRESLPSFLLQEAYWIPRIIWWLGSLPMQGYRKKLKSDVQH